MIHGPDQIELAFSGRFLEVEEPERLSMTVTDTADADAEPVETLDRRSSRTWATSGPR